MEIAPRHEYATNDKRNDASGANTSKNNRAKAILVKRRYIGRCPTHSGRNQTEEGDPINGPINVFVDLLKEPEFAHADDASAPARLMSSIRISMSPSSLAYLPAGHNGPVASSVGGRFSPPPCLTVRRDPGYFAARACGGRR